MTISIIYDAEIIPDWYTPAQPAQDSGYALPFQTKDVPAGNSSIISFKKKNAKFCFFILKLVFLLPQHPTVQSIGFHHQFDGSTMRTPTIANSFSTDVVRVQITFIL